LKIYQYRPRNWHTTESRAADQARFFRFFTRRDFIAYATWVTASAGHDLSEKILVLRENEARFSEVADSIGPVG